MFPPALRMPVTVLAHLVTVAFCGVIVALGIIYVFGETGLYRLAGRFPHTGIPEWIVAVAIPWSFAIIGIRIAIAAARVALGDPTAKGSCPNPAPTSIGHGAPPKPGSSAASAEGAS
jgi:TRAP-type C4-dicarboxylate transport system permease small subunit